VLINASIWALFVVSSAWKELFSKLKLEKTFFYFVLFKAVEFAKFRELIPAIPNKLFQNNK
jgi:hypothetical protein